MGRPSDYVLVDYDDASRATRCSIAQEVIVGTPLLGLQLDGHGRQSNPPMFVYLGTIWAIGLVLHFRAVRRVL